MPWRQSEFHQMSPSGLIEVYSPLRRIARKMLLQEYRQETLQGTALVHEALIRLRDYRGLVSGPSHYMSLAIGAMRRVLIDRGRSRNSQKRTACEFGPAAVQPESVEVIALRLAFRKLCGYDRESGQAIRLYFFEGYTLHETAGRLGVTVARVRSLLTFAEAWLRDELSSSGAPQAAFPNRRSRRGEGRD